MVLSGGICSCQKAIEGRILEESSCDRSKAAVKGINNAVPALVLRLPCQLVEYVANHDVSNTAIGRGKKC